MGRRPPRDPIGRAAASGLIVLLLLVATLAGARASTPPPPPPPPPGPQPLPLGVGDEIVNNVSAPTLAPGASGSLTFTVTDRLNASIGGIALTFEVYRFVPYPGNASGPAPSGSSPILTGGGVPAETVVISLGALAPGGSSHGTVSVNAPGGAADGAYLIRSAANFSSAGLDYRVASRGYFSDALWSQATTGPNGTGTLNLTVLGVSGIAPETAVLVRSNPFTPIVVGLIVGAFVLAGVGGYFAWRSRGASRSGTEDGDSSK